MNEITPELKKERNIWKLATIIFGIIALLLLVGYGIKNYKTDKDICSQVKYTPSWIFNNTIIQTGYIQLVKDSNGTGIFEKEIIRERIIDNGIGFAYTDGCSYCDLQIQEFKQIGLWDEYVSKGLTYNCTK